MTPSPTPTQAEMNKIMQEMEELMQIMDIKFPNEETSMRKRILLGFYPDLGVVIEQSFAFIRAQSSQLSQMTEEANKLRNGVQHASDKLHFTAECPDNDCNNCKTTSLTVAHIMDELLSTIPVR